MTAASKSHAPKTKRRATDGGPTYRGVHLRLTDLPSQFTREQIKEAVEAAIRKHPDAFAASKKA
jgi:hypothetical protein